MIAHLDNMDAQGAAPAASNSHEIRTLVFDIETGPADAETLDAMAPEFEAPANYRDPVKIADAIAEKRLAWVERAALSPTTGRVLAIGLIADGLYQDGAVYSPAPDDERLLLEWFLGKVSRRTVLIGFNSNRFDLPFIIRRCWALGVAVPPQLLAHRFGGASLDLMEAWQLGDRGETISLDRLARYLGLGGKSGDGKNFARLLQTDREAAMAYLANDVTLTARIAAALGVIDPVVIPAGAPAPCEY